jgi:hypothetical protein
VFIRQVSHTLRLLNKLTIPIRGQLEENDPLEAEAEFIAFWNQGLEIAAIAQRLGLPRSTVQSRAHRLQQQGTIQPRLRGGNDPSQRAKARQEDPHQCRDQCSSPTPLQCSGSTGLKTRCRAFASSSNL